MSEYLEAFVGWIIWNLILLSISKNKSDKQKLRFPWGRYFYELCDDMAVSFVSILPLVWYMDDICSVFTKVVHYIPGVPDDFVWPVGDINYMGAGILAQFLYFVVEWVINKKTTFLKGLHKESGIDEDKD